MADPVVIYSLGRKGVNLVDDPLILENGELTLGQNAQTSPNESDGSLLKRGGMAALLQVGSGGAVRAILSIPFADPSPGSLIVAGYPGWPILPDPLPDAPTADPDLITDVAITFAWLASDDPTVTGYRIDLSTEADFSTLVIDNEDVGNVLSHEVTGLSAETPYYLRVRTENVRGSSTNSPAGTATTEASAVPEFGTWEIPVDSVTGWAAGIAVWFPGTPQGDEAEGGTSETIEATFSATQIKLNGGAAQPISGLPAGFTLTLARAYVGNWRTKSGAPGGYSVTISGLWSEPLQSPFPSLAQDYRIHTFSGPPALGALAGGVISVAFSDGYAGLSPPIVVAPGFAGLMLYGNYMVV